MIAFSLTGLLHLESQDPGRADQAPGLGDRRPV